MGNETLELNVHNDNKSGKWSTFLGKVKISGTSFAKVRSETLIYYRLENRSIFSQIKGKIGLKVSFVDDGSPKASAEAAPVAEEAKSEEKSAREEKKSEAEEKKLAEEEKKPAGEEKKPAEEEKKAEEPKKEDKKRSATKEEEKKKKSAEKAKS